MTPSSRVVLAVVAVVGAAGTAVVGTSATAATARHHRPNLVVGALDLTVTGRTVSGTVTVRNTGSAGAARSVTSAGGERIATPSIRAGHRARLVVATTLPAGATRVRVCADAGHRVREQREGDNCRTYTVPTTPGPTGTGPTGTGPSGTTTTPTPYTSDPSDPPISHGVHPSISPPTY